MLLYELQNDMLNDSQFLLILCLSGSVKSQMSTPLLFGHWQTGTEAGASECLEAG
jgi:hypothetical protein